MARQASGSCRRYEQLPRSCEDENIVHPHPSKGKITPPQARKNARLRRAFLRRFCTCACRCNTSDGANGEGAGASVRAESSNDAHEVGSPAAGAVMLGVIGDSVRWSIDTREGLVLSQAKDDPGPSRDGALKWIQGISLCVTDLSLPNRSDHLRLLDWPNPLPRTLYMRRLVSNSS